MPVAALLLTVLEQILTMRLHSVQNSSPQARCWSSWPVKYTCSILVVLCIITDNYDQYTNFISELYIYIFLQILLLPKHTKLQQTLYPWFLEADLKNCEDKLKSGVFL